MRHSPTRPEDEACFDFFVSYKSEDAVNVRAVSECLIASGLNPWFAEYKILLQNRAGFRKSLAQGIKRSRFGLCFTNDRYAVSKWTTKELKLLLHRLGPSQIMNVEFPRESEPLCRFPRLANAHAMDVRGVRPGISPGVLRGITRFLASKTGLPIQECGIDIPTTPWLQTRSAFGERYTLDFAGWRPKKSLLMKVWGWFDKSDAHGPHFSWNSAAPRLRGHLLIGPMGDVKRGKLRAGEADDRKYYDAALDFARHYFEDVNSQECHGVHLLFLEGYSHVAITTRPGARFGPDVWSRLYSVVLPSLRQNGDLEYAFFFFLKGDFREFCRYAHLMDRLVLSLRRE